MTTSKEGLRNLVRMSFNSVFDDADPRRLHGLARMARASGMTPEQTRELLQEGGAPDIDVRVAVDGAFRIPEHELRIRIGAAIEATAAGQASGDGKNVRNGVDDADRAVFAMIRIIGED